MTDQDRLDLLLAALRPARRTVVVDVGASGIETPPYQFLLTRGACEVWGFEPQEQEYRKLVAAAGPNERYLPHAVGDGTTRPFRMTRNPGFSSTLVPNRQVVTALKRWKSDTTVVSTFDVPTVRLDDLQDLPDFDLLKIDIQGGEVSVFDHGQARLARALAVVTEAAAIPIYENQPLLGDQMQCLARSGYALHKFAFFRSVPFRGRLTKDIPAPHLEDQLTDGDAIFVRQLLDLEGHDTEALKHLAILADFVFGSLSLALKSVTLLADRGAVTEAEAQSYARALRTKVTGSPRA